MELLCPDGDGVTYELCACSTADDGHCQWCCRPFAEHSASNHVRAVIVELTRRWSGALRASRLSPAREATSDASVLLVNEGTPKDASVNFRGTPPKEEA